MKIGPSYCNFHWVAGKAVAPVIVVCRKPLCLDISVINLLENNSAYDPMEVSAGEDRAGHSHSNDATST